MPTVSRFRPLALVLLALLALLSTAGCAAEEEALRWCWSGGIAADGAVVVAAVDGIRELELRVAEADGDEVARVEAEAGAHGVARFAVTDLEPATAYRYRLHGADAELGAGAFTTLPEPLTPADFTVALSSCCDQPNSRVFEAIAHQQPLFFLHNGDLHYSDIGVDEPERFRAAFERNLTAPHQAALYRALPVVYTWDDHDYGPNNSGHDSPARPAAHAVYREYVPHHPFALAGEAAPIARAFTVGRVRFVLTDLRSDKHREPGSLLGAQQREWFLAEFRRAAQDHALVVWVSTVPWNGDGGSRDRWEGNPEERRLIADFVAEHRIPLCILSGDAHMSAIDDGSNSDFATHGGAPIPVFQAGSLSKNGSYKGGPYSHGARPGGQQFGLMRVVDHGDRLEVFWSAHDGSDGVGDEVLTATRDGDGPIAYRFDVAR